MIRYSFLLIGVLSLIYGTIFLFFPNWFVNLTMAESINIAWLRSIGSAIVGLLFLGCFSIYSNPKGKFELLKIISITSLLQTFALIYSRIFNEFSAKNLWIIDLTIILAIVVTIFFLFVYFAKHIDFE
jgi:hypothetical protein|tara:strand:- start:2688 stop:3071 length:384 start_codon:yes stop_codon:yes gene_type:complete